MVVRYLIINTFFELNIQLPTQVFEAYLNLPASFDPYYMLNAKLTHAIQCLLCMPSHWHDSRFMYLCNQGTENLFKFSAEDSVLLYWLLKGSSVAFFQQSIHLLWYNVVILDLMLHACFTEMWRQWCACSLSETHLKITVLIYECGEVHMRSWEALCRTSWLVYA